GTGAARGCHTLLQATAVSDRWGTQNFGALNALFNAPMTAVTALAPVSGPLLASLVGGYPALAIVMAVLLTMAAALSARTCTGAGHHLCHIPPRRSPRGNHHRRRASRPGHRLLPAAGRRGHPRSR